ncbi:MAG: stage V sporulation protein AC [Clostridia bacterium]|nr:stage V sporulation protein AC [Clostridia bacterium]
MDKEQINISYCKFVENRLPKTKFFPSLLWAFLVGGLICCIGQGINDGLSAIFPALNKDDIQAYTLIILIFLASFLTGIGVYDRIGAFAGAGSIVPITGFSNSIASPAIEFKNEGLIFGLCVKMFSVAGPVIVTGIASSILVGIIYLIVGII